MDETKYHIEADKCLQFLEELEEQHEISVELDSGVMSVVMPDEREYVINKHTPSRQIWVASPYTGAGYFEFKEGDWLVKRATAEATGKNLFNFIKTEILSHL
jgi:frataxin